MKRILSMGLLLAGVCARETGSLSYALLALYAAVVGVRAYICLRHMRESGLQTREEKDNAFFYAMMVAACVICLIVMHPAYLRQTRCISPVQRLMRERGIRGRVSSYEMEDGTRVFSYRGAETSRDALEAIKKTEEDGLKNVRVPEDARISPSEDACRIDGKAYEISKAKWKGETYDFRKQTPLKRMSPVLLRILFLFVTGGLMAGALYVCVGGGPWPKDPALCRTVYGTIGLCTFIVLIGNLYPVLKYRTVSKKKAGLEKAYDAQDRESFYGDIKNTGERYNAFGKKADRVYEYAMPLLNDLEQHYKTLKNLLRSGKDPDACQLTIECAAFEGDRRKLLELFGEITEEEKEDFPEIYASMVYLGESYLKLFEALRNVKTYEDLRGYDVDLALGDFFDADACFSASVARDKLLLETGFQKAEYREVE